MEDHSQQQNLQAYNQEAFDFDSLVLKRADPDDCDQIINLVEIGKDDVYNRVYAYPKILKLIETSFLAITVLDREGRVVAFAAFEDSPQGLRGMYDEKHYNYWESWFKEAYGLEEFTSFNTVWLNYFVAGGSIPYDDWRHIFKKVLQTVYTSLEDRIGVMFLLRGDADQEDIQYCFDPLREHFQELNCKQREILKDVRGIHFNSKIFFSSRVTVLPFIEVRTARQEDHDDLADVFNSQSDTVTEAYGEYFIAELIAAQNENNKALVAQVKDKAVGLMGLTREVDVNLLHQCFELDAYDNLLKPEFMTAVRNRRAAVLDERRKQAEEQRLLELKRLKEETMKCNVIAQRIALQEFLMENQLKIEEDIDKYIGNDQELAKSEDIKREHVEMMFQEWLSGFELTQPSDYFMDHPTDDYELQCNIQTEQEFLITCLEMFGLPRSYMEGTGHFPDAGKDKEKKGQRRPAGKKGKTGKTAAQRAKEKRGIKDDKDEDKKPTHFDLEPFKKAMMNFCKCNGKERSELRGILRGQEELLQNIFVDEYGEQSFKKCVDVMTLGKTLHDKNVQLSSIQQEFMGSMLICFGDVQYEIKGVWRLPEESEAEKREKLIAKMKEEAEREAAEAGEDGKAKKGKDKKKAAPKADEAHEPKEEKKKEPPKRVLIWLYQASIHDLLESVGKMQDYDFVLADLGKMSADLSEERNQHRNMAGEVDMHVVDGADSKLEESKGQLDNENASQGEGSQRGSELLTGSRPGSGGILGRKQQRQEPVVKEPEPDPLLYCNDYDYEEIVKELDDLDAIPEPPEKAKNAFAITLFCMEAAFESRSKDFLQYAFDLYPDRDYLIVTQPHTIAENSLLQKFINVQKKSENTFSHVLYIIHRDFLLEQDMSVNRALKDDLEQVNALIEETDENAERTKEEFYEATMNPDSAYLSFVAKIYDQVIGCFTLAKDVNLEYYKSHFHIQDSILLNEHDRKSHTRLLHSVVNPIFEKSTRFILKELLRLSAKTCLYFEVNPETVIPTIFHELVHVRQRRFPHFLRRKWDHERYVPENAEKDDEDKIAQIDGGKRDYLDEEQSSFALCFTTKRLLSEPKITKNSRIVVVGASDTGISFIEALLSISYLHFTNVVLVAPGGLPHRNFSDRNDNLKSQSTSYTQRELSRLMLETRVRVIDARMIDIDRPDKNLVLNDDTILPYDTLVLTMGIQDKTLNSLGFISRGIAPLPDQMKRMEGLISIDDPTLYDHLRPNGTLMTILTNRKRPQPVVIYGRSLSAYAAIQGLRRRGVRPEQVTLVLPKPECHVRENYDEDEVAEMEKDLPFINQEAWDDEKIEAKMQEIVEGMGVRIVRNAHLIQVIPDEEEQLGSALFKLLDVPEEDTESDLGMEEEKSKQDQESRMGSHHEGESLAEGDMDNSVEEEQQQQKKRRKKNILELDCKVLLTAGHRDVDLVVFNSIHNNGLVYNGRLIVDKNFQTTDPSIFAAGALCEFSGRYKAMAQGKPLRMDRYNGREMGSRLARSVFDIYDPSLGGHSNPADPSSMQDDLPTFYLPQGQGANLLGDLIFYHIKTTNPLILKEGLTEKKNRKDLVCDNLNGTKGHFIKFTFNSIGLIDSVTYIGSEEIVLQSLWSFVGLHENYLNELTSRYEKGIIPNVAEFLSENWAIALYHEWFGDFCLRLRHGVQGMRDVQIILEKAFQMTSNGEGLTREVLQDLEKMVGPKTVKMVEDETLEFIKVNMNHLPMYYIPGEEFA